MQRKGENYRCVTCGSEFTKDGIMLKEKWKPNKCPLDDCGCKSISAKEDGFLCRICGTEFMLDGTITKEGKRMLCPLKGCGNRGNIITKGNGFYAGDAGRNLCKMEL